MGWEGARNSRARRGPPRRPRLLAQDLLDPRNRLVDRPLGADAFGGDAVQGLRPDMLLPNPVVSPVARYLSVVVKERARADLHDRGHPMRVPRVEPERRIEQLLHRWQHALAGEVEI